MDALYYRSMTSPTERRRPLAALISSFALFASATLAQGAATPELQKYREHIKPLLNEYCSDCHMDGMDKGSVAFDAFKSDEELLAKKELWLSVLKNVRGGLMPPEKKKKPSAEQIAALSDWIKSGAFAIDPANPDPGKVTIRRLNRNEYRNTIRELTGHDYKVEEELPPDDTGYGFDNIGDVLTLSPLLLEKYMQAAEQITRASVPRESLMVREKTLIGNGNRRDVRDRISFYEGDKIQRSSKIDTAGTYKVGIDIDVFSQFDFDPGRVRVVVKAGDVELIKEELGWGKNFKKTAEHKFEKGALDFQIEITPLVPVEQKKNSLELRVANLRLEGPLEKEHWDRPANFARFFTKDPPKDAAERRIYAGEVLRRFAEKAYRRPVDQATVDRLVGLAESIWTQPGKKFEDGIAETMTPILASPRFLFRLEDTEAPSNGKAHPLIDEYALASRLSYFLWSTMPDEELMGLARKGELRKNLSSQVDRMMRDDRSREFIRHFVGQWLMVRDIDGIDMNVREILGRDGSGPDADAVKRRKRIEELREIPEDKMTPEQQAELRQLFQQGRARRGNQLAELDGPLRRALREETEMAFDYVVRQNRPVTELIDANYTFMNERLARHYNISNITGMDMRKVDLPEGSVRGGILTHGSTLIVTSNPTRTSPVKRGLFILDNVLGTPPPPPPPDVPDLEAAEKELSGGKTPTLRESLELHRSKPLCMSCHNRMDPLGFALENFNAIGMWRDKERGQDIDAAGQLVTGEQFKDVREAKTILATKYKKEFYRTLTEKVMTYALGRGVEYYDVAAVDEIVARLEKEEGRFSALLAGVIESAPFQKRRNPDFQPAEEPAAKTEHRASLD